MPPFGPVSQRDLVRALRQLGFGGLVSGTSHPFMVKGALKLRLANLHQGGVGRELLARLLREAGINREDWESV